MKLLRAVLLSIFLLGVVSVSLAMADVNLVREGKSQATITLATKLPEGAQAAAALQTYLGKMSGAKLPIVKLPPAAQSLAQAKVQPGLLLCEPEFLQGAALDAASRDCVSKIRDDGFALVQAGRPDLLAIVAIKPVALLYGAYDVLQRLGCRWYFPGDLGEEIPTSKTLSLPVTNEVSNPSMIERSVWYAYGGRPAWQTDAYHLWQVRNKMGGVGASMGHNMMKVLPLKPYAQTHPEYFPLWNGQRHIPKPGEVSGWQPCTSNPGVIKLAIQAADKYFTANPDAYSFSLSPNDGYGWCQCANCRAQDPPDHRDSLEHYKARRMLLFVNAVARAIAKSHPGKFLAWYAYAGTVEPPTDVKAEPNVVTCLAHYGYVGDNVHAIQDPTSKNNAEFRKLVEGWQKVAPHLMAREYWSVLCGEQDAMARVCAAYSLAQDIPYYVSHGFIGVSSESEPEYGSSALNFYLAAKLMWNCHQPLEPLLADYYRGMYGPAAGAMRTFFEGIVHRCRTRGSRGNFFTDQDYADMATQLQQAYALAATDKQRARIKMTQDFLHYTDLIHQYNLKPTRAKREEITALVAQVDASHSFTLDTVMFKRTFGRSQKITIKDPGQYVVKSVQPVGEGSMPKGAEKVAAAVRGTHSFGLLLRPGEKLQAAVTVRRLGRYTNPVAWALLDGTGKVVKQGQASIEEASAIDQPQAAPGIYTIVTNSGQNACTVTSPDQYLAIRGPDIHFLGRTPWLYFYVPNSTRSFWISLQTDAPGETGALTIADPQGQEVARGDTVQTGMVKLSVTVPAGQAGKVWRMRVTPAKNVCEDNMITLGPDVAPYLSTDPARVVAGAK